MFHFVATVIKKSLNYSSAQVIHRFLQLSNPGITVRKYLHSKYVNIGTYNFIVKSFIFYSELCKNILLHALGLKYSN